MNLLFRLLENARVSASRVEKSGKESCQVLETGNSRESKDNLCLGIFSSTLMYFFTV